ncbi:hypothetical protein F4820DRAFT_457114 [Hypoxylon rubiginosum]|uniref:Uncharacterized protein n=1 Tax=Hypoxylon rubiginosum TaxID=110542 RepID=A0ACB9Z7A0_9PEZI|nr:hypothetical protein F4820DRAFT_457114 [Hypoxylon rubiginosum]
MAIATDELRSQWVNPSDILSLLLLIGGDIVQKAIAQLVGHKIHLYGNRNLGLSIVPVAFSFGWAAYGFSNLLSAVGDMRLMPTSDCPSVLVNCSNGFVRENQSWVLGRLLRDHEIRYDIDPRSKEEGGRAESIRIDIFNLLPVSSPGRDFVWWLGWATLLVQVGIAVIPWVLYDDCGVMLITLCGNFLVATTCALPQWTQEKWGGRPLGRDKVTCLTRGNGHFHIMVFIGTRGSWDLESLATLTLIRRPETRWISLLLAVLWTCLLISVSGLQEHTWFLIAIGGIGMLQNIFAAGTAREPGASNFHISRFSRASTIIGRRENYKDDIDSEVNLEEDLEELADLAVWASGKPPQSSQDYNSSPTKTSSMPQWLASMASSDGVPSWLEPLKPVQLDQATKSPPQASHFISRIWQRSVADNSEPNEMIYAVGVHGALMELEKWVPTAGLAMAQVFFPAGLKYNDEAIRDNVHKKFWQRAYHTKSVRKRAEEKRRAEEETRAPKTV